MTPPPTTTSLAACRLHAMNTSGLSTSPPNSPRAVSTFRPPTMRYWFLLSQGKRLPAESRENQLHRRRLDLPLVEVRVACKAAADLADGVFDDGLLGVFTKQIITLGRTNSPTELQDPTGRDLNIAMTPAHPMSATRRSDTRETRTPTTSEQPKCQLTFPKPPTTGPVKAALTA